MLTLYRLLMRVAVPLMLLRLVWRSRQNADYARALPQRLGYSLPPARPLTPSIGADSATEYAHHDAASAVTGAPRLLRQRLWIHAVSVGETLAIAPLVARLLDASPEVSVLMTSTTPTGAAQVQRLFGERVEHCWVPFDTPGAVRRFLDHWQPTALALVETEVWPSAIVESRRRGLAVLLLNARLSKRSARGYARVAPLAQPVLAAITTIAAQSHADARRFAALGVSSSALSVVGSIKFEIDREAMIQQRDGLLTTLNIAPDRPVWLAASTHDGEEQQVLAAFAAIRAEIPNALLILVPRHPERCRVVAALPEARQWRVQLRTDGGVVHSDTEVLLVDTLGELGALMGLAQVVFVAGSLVAHGGHNPLEAAAFGCAIVHGPHTFNFETIYRDLTRVGACLCVASPHALAAEVSDLLKNSHRRATMGTQASVYLDTKKGALDRQYTLVLNALKGTQR